MTVKIITAYSVEDDGGSNFAITENSLRGIVPHLRKILLISRASGTLPYSEIESPDGKRRLVWKWNSWASFYTILLDSLLIGTVLYGMYRYVDFNLYIRRKSLFFGGNVTTTSLEKFSISVLPFVHPVLFITFLWSGIFSTSSFLRVIEGWNNFEMYFSTIFINRRNLFEETMKEAHRRGVMTLFFILLTLLPLNFMLRESFCYLPLKSPSPYHGDHESRQNSYNTLGQVICNCGTTLPIFNLMLSYCEDFKNIVLVRLIANSFTQVRLAISDRGWVDRKQQKSVQRVRSWQTILSLIRNQAKMTESATSTQNFIAIFVFFVLFCFSLFLGIMMISDDGMTKASKQTTYNAIVLSIIGCGRLWVKARHTETITAEEKQLANILRTLDLGINADEELMTRLELSILVDTIDRKPTFISIHGLFELNYALLATTLTTVVTYLVVLLQFNNMETS